VEAKSTGASKLGAAAEAPAVASAAPAIEAPVALGVEYARVQEVLFSRAPASPAAVVALGVPRPGTREWDPLREPDFAVGRVDLATGKPGMAVRLPIFSKLMAVSPDATVAVVASDGGDRAAREPMGRLDVVNLMTGKTVATFRPYADIEAAAAAKSGEGGNSSERPRASAAHAVTWAAMLDNDALLTLGASHVLVRWSLAERKAIWARGGVTGAPVLSHGSKYLATPQEGALLLIDPGTGDAVGSLAAEAIARGQWKAAMFSDDGAALYASSGAGLFRWDLASGASGDPLTSDGGESQLQDLGKGHLLADERLFDVNGASFVFTYLPVGGRHLYTAPSPGRHWYLARAADGSGGAYLCSAAIPTAEQLQLAGKFAADPSLIRPGERLRTQVDCGRATDRVAQAVKARLASRHLDTGNDAATLRVVAVELPSDEEAPVTTDYGMQKVGLQEYQCSFDLVDSSGKVLYGSANTRTLRLPAGVVAMKEGQSASSRVEELLEERLVDWVDTIYLPRYLTASGKIPELRPEALLGVGR
jgi:hypothetical protein